MIFNFLFTMTTILSMSSLSLADGLVSTDKDTIATLMELPPCKDSKPVQVPQELQGMYKLGETTSLTLGTDGIAGSTGDLLSGKTKSYSDGCLAESVETDKQGNSVYKMTVKQNYVRWYGFQYQVESLFLRLNKSSGDYEVGLHGAAYAGFAWVLPSKGGIETLHYQKVSKVE